MAFELTGLQGKVAVVTGAGRMRSIGRPVAVSLARAGCDVVLTGSGKSVSQYPAEEQAAGWRDTESVADEVRALGRRALTVVSDVGDAQAVQALAERVVAEFGRVDILVNNAGSRRGADRQPVTELPLQEWHRVVDTNLDGTFYMSRAFAQQMQACGHGGAIVNISSVVARALLPNTAAYAASKAGINALTTIMAGELGPHGIRVNAVAPGLIDTSRMDAGRTEAQWNEYVAKAIPLGRAGTGQDVADAVVFLCSDQASWLTGQVLYVDGGVFQSVRR
jgi:3-oxoacyl-[acyl-carrier protein] reductase